MKIISLSALMTVSVSVASFAQIIDADKSTVSAPETNVVEIYAVAIPFADKDKYDLINENYHRAITIGTDSVVQEQTIEISAVAQRPGDGVSQTQKKEIIIVSPAKEDHSAKKQHSVEITSKAIKR